MFGVVGYIELVLVQRVFCFVCCFSCYIAAPSVNELCKLIDHPGFLLGSSRVTLCSCTNCAGVFLAFLLVEYKMPKVWFC